MVFQNPDSTLNPQKTVEDELRRPLRLFGIAKPRIGDSAPRTGSECSGYHPTFIVEHALATCRYQGISAQLTRELVDDALEKLAAIDPRKGKVVEMRFFGGLTVEETAEALSVSPLTVKRDWKMAKAWLYNSLNHDDA